MDFLSVTSFREQMSSNFDSTDSGPRSWFGNPLTGNRDASGLVYRRNRYYDPNQGRFTQEDPIGLAGGLNLYGFADGDPVNFSDPFGLCPVPITNCLDIAMAVSSMGKFAAAPSLGTGINAALDLAGALPGVPSVGVIKRAISGAGDIAGGARHIDDPAVVVRGGQGEFRRRASSFQVLPEELWTRRRAEYHMEQSAQVQPVKFALVVVPWCQRLSAHGPE